MFSFTRNLIPLFQKPTSHHQLTPLAVKPLVNQIDNIEFIDQSTSHDVLPASNNKGYHTVDDKSSYPRKHPLSSKKSSGSVTEDDVFVTPTAKMKTKSRTKTTANKRKLKKDKRMHSSSGELRSDPSSSSSSGGSKGKKEIITTIRTITTDTETRKLITTTTSLNRYTFTKLMDDKGGILDDDKKLRTQSCSSIPYDDIIHNLAVFRKSFDNMNIFEDETLCKDIVIYRKTKEPIEKTLSCNKESIRPFVNDMLTEIFEAAVKVVSEKELEKPQRRSPVIKCRTSDILTGLFIPKIVQTPSTDNLIDARNFVEEYEEFHDSCSELPTSASIADDILTEITDIVDRIVTQKSKKKVVKHGGVTCCIAVETDSNAEDEQDLLPQNDKRLLEVGPKYNVPKKIFNLMTTEMTEITDQNIAENNPEMVDPPEVVVLPKEGKDFGVEDDDDVYKPIAVSPCGRFFKYEEEVSLLHFNLMM